MSNNIELNQIVKKIKHRNVLNGIDLVIPANTITALIGINGAGKTTLLKCIAGLLKYEGNIKYQGMNDNNGRVEGNLGSYIQDVPALYPYMTGYEYLNFCKRVLEKDTKRIDIDSLLSDVGLNHSEANSLIATYSRGMKQRLIIAQHLISNSKLLLFDEPTSALDPIAKIEILKIICKLKERCTVVISSHEIESVMEVADRIAVIHRGRILYSNSTNTYYEESNGYLEIMFVDPCKYDVISTVFAGIANKKEILLNGNTLKLVKPISLKQTIQIQQRLAQQGVYFHGFKNRKDIKEKLSEIISEDNYE